MNKSNLILRASVAALLAGSIGTATAETVNGNADAEVVTALTLSEAASLDFGQVAGGTVAGSVTVDETGARSSAGGAAVVSASVPSKATFAITGAINTAITVTLATAGAELDDGAGGTAMPLSAFTTTALPVITDGGGLASFDLGATITVNAPQLPGFYDTTNGTPYTVTVNYN